MLLQELINQNKLITYQFQKDGVLRNDGPECGMTLRAGGSMRFRWNENNPNRDALLSKVSAAFGNKTPVPVELIHSQIVYSVKTSKDTLYLTGDGIITDNMDLMPVVTVADCVPIYFYDWKNKIIGIVHSGWKGTGIIGKAFELSQKMYGSDKEDCSIIIGPHIHDCCYIVNEERAEYFANNFTPDCVTPLEENGKCFAGGRGLAIEWDNGKSKLFRLSLEKANLAAIEKTGIPKENIRVINECTCCNELYGSNRRETAILSKELGRKLSPEEAGKKFTVQAAFIAGK